MILWVIFNLSMCNSSRLWKTIHPLSNIYIDFAVVCNFSEIIFIYILLGCYVKGKLNVFLMVHWCVEIKVCYICTQHMESGFDIVLLIRVLAVMVYYVGVVTSPG